MSINLHIYPSTIEYESRILRVTASLAATGRFEEIHIVGMHRDGLAEREQLDTVRHVWRVPVRALPLPGPGRRAAALVAWMRRVHRAYRAAPLACVNPHSLTVLPLAARLKRSTGAALVYDTHELETETAASRLRKTVARVVERTYMPAVDATVVVSDSIADWYRARYPDVPVYTVKNYPVAQRRPAAGGLRHTLGLPDDALVFLYQGLLTHGRGIELLLRAFPDDAADRHLVFMGYGPLQARIEAEAARRSAVHYHPAVPPEQVLRYTVEADVGLSLIEPISRSYRYCLPNKLLEYLSCGVPPVVSALPDMVREIEDGRLGWAVAPEQEAVAALLRGLTPAAVRQRATRLDGWADTHAWTHMEVRLHRLYDTLLGPRAAAPEPSLQTDPIAR